ncbi:2322_t:CDS:1 [Funneliformis geosporum]|nr:2322_t:CDS:1 [Funneliformis geosporum]
MSKPMSVALFGPTGQGKSTVANMLVQGDIHRENNAFVVKDAAVGIRDQTNRDVSETFEVVDIIGVCQTNFKSTPHKKAVKSIRNYFSKYRGPLNYICYVKKKGEFTKEDSQLFKVFKEIFKGGERNIIIIITDCEPEWVNENSKTIENNFGDYPTIAVDFPTQGHDAVAKRAKSLERLTSKLSSLNYKGIKLETLNSLQLVENKVSNVIGFVPLIGTGYQLISSVAYFVDGRPIVATERLVDGAADLVFGKTIMIVGHKFINPIVKVVSEKIVHIFV